MRNDEYQYSECIQEYVDDKPTVVCGCIVCWPQTQDLEEKTPAQQTFKLRYIELREALVGDTDNWTHEELIERAFELVNIAREVEE